MKTKAFISALLLSFGIGIMLFSCTKEEVSSTDLNAVSQDETKIDNYFDDASSETDMYDNGTKSAELKSNCTPTVSITHPTQGSFFPKHIVIDYGTDGCEGYFGHVRKGKIIVVQTNFMIVPGALRTITYENFYLDDFKIEGTRTVTSNGLNAEQNYQRTTVLSNGKITTPDGKIISRSAEHIQTWISGSQTPINIFDDKWQITGSAAGTNRNGKSYTSVITSPLIFDLSCTHKITQGVKTITTDNHVIVIDFGNGDCDSQIDITIDGV